LVTQTNFPKNSYQDNNSKNIKSIGLIINGLSEGGVLNLNFESYLNGIRVLSCWCQLNSVLMKIRCRPDMPIRNFLNSLFYGNENIIVDDLFQSVEEGMSKDNATMAYYQYRKYWTLL
jgi:hypothetical protein